MGAREECTVGHNGGGPGYAISAFRRGDKTLCVICDGDEAEPEKIVREILAGLGA